MTCALQEPTISSAASALISSSGCAARWLFIMFIGCKLNHTFRYPNLIRHITGKVIYVPPFTRLACNRRPAPSASVSAVVLRVFSLYCAFLRDQLRPACLFGALNNCDMMMR
jgi:hypothetical protein